MLGGKRISYLPIQKCKNAPFPPMHDQAESGKHRTLPLRTVFNDIKLVRGKNPNIFLWALSSCQNCSWKTYFSCQSTSADSSIKYRKVIWLHFLSPSAQPSFSINLGKVEFLRKFTFRKMTAESPEKLIYK